MYLFETEMERKFHTKISLGNVAMPVNNYIDLAVSESTFSHIISFEPRCTSAR